MGSSITSWPTSSADAPRVLELIQTYLDPTVERACPSTVGAYVATCALCHYLANKASPTVSGDHRNDRLCGAAAGVAAADGAG